MNDTTNPVSDALVSGAVADRLSDALVEYMADLTGLPVPAHITIGFHTHLQAQLNNMAMYYEPECGDETDRFMEALVNAGVTA